MVMSLTKEKIYRAAILTIPGIGSQRLRQLIALYGSAENAWKTQQFTDSPERFSWFQKFKHARQKIDLEKVESLLVKENISMVILGEENYPCLLAECLGAPPLLFYKGVLTSGQKGLAVVGSRRATAYGRAAAAYFAKELVKHNYIVVSGLARGIDSSAHQGALDGNGVTWAFLAGGLDSIYPKENSNLARRIMEKGALISEYPPGIPAEPGHFPARNRLISGSSMGVLVVEAAEKSGSLITVDYALEQGREVYAVPGPIFSEQSKGTHNLIKIGAKLVAGIEDILCELPPGYRTDFCKQQNDHLQTERRQSLSENALNEEASYTKDEIWQEILECLSDVPLHIDRLTAICKISAQDIALGLLELQLAGKVIQLPGQNYVLQRKV